MVSRRFNANVKFFGAALIALGSVLVPELAVGQIYTFTNAASGVPSSVAANATGTPLTRGAGLDDTVKTCSGATDGFSADSWPTYNYGGSNILATPNASGDYIEFSITPDPGYKFNITGFTAQLRRDNPAGTANDGPTQVRYAYSTDGFANFTQNGANLAPGTNTSCANAGTVRVWAAFPSFITTQTVTFRIYGFSSGAAQTGDLYVRNVVVSGTVERISINLSTSASVSAANCGDIFDVTVQADTGFQQLAGMQFSLNWDADQFNFLAYSAVQIGGNDPMLDSTNNDNGELAYSWLGNCTTLPNGSNLLTVQFQVVGCSATDEPVNLAGIPLSLEATDCNGADIQVVATNNALVDISAGSPVALSCPGDQTQPAGQTQAAIDAAYRAWINAFTFSGGCFPEASFDLDTSVMPSACGDTIVATYTVTSSCGTASCTDTFIVTPVPDVSIIQFGGNPFANVCVGDTAVFRAAVPDGNAPAVPVQTYAWTLSGSPAITPAGALGADGVTQRRQEAVYSAGDVGGQTVNLTVTYTNGCVETAAQHTITVHALPAMTCPANTSVCIDDTALDLTTLSPTPAPTPGVFSGPGVTGNNFDPNAAGLGTHSITYVHTNGNGCTDSCSFTITVEPAPTATVEYNTAPEGNCASGETVCSNETTDVTFSLSNGDELIVTEIRHEWASNDGNVCAPGASSGYGAVTGSTIQVGDDVASGITEFFVNDSTENVRVTFVLEPRSSTGAQCAGATVTVNIVIEPMPRLVNCPGDTTLQTGAETPGDCLAEYIWDHPTTLGGCSPVTLVMQIDGGTPVSVTPGDPTVEEFNKGVHTVAYTATDSEGNEDTCSFNVTVQDNEPPTITCPAGSPFARNTDAGECNYTVQGAEFNATFVENCPGATLTNSFNNTNTLAGADLPNGSTTITWTITDGMNMASTNCQIVVNVTDNEPPTITCPAGSPFARNTDAGECNYTVQGTEFNPTAFGDNCPGSTITNDFNNTNTLAGADLPKGSTTITWTVTDGMSMSSTSCQIVVDVTDNQPPTITCPAGSPFARNTDAGQCDYTVQGAEFDPTAFNDNCPGSTITNSFNNTNTLAGADLPKGPTTIVWTVTDGMSMSSISCQIVVNVTDNQSPTIDCAFPSPFARVTDAGECNYTVSGIEFDPVAFDDNCPGSTISNNFNNTNTLAGADLPKGSNTIIWTVTDGMNMASTTCAIVVNVTDDQPPTITCPAGSPFARNTDAGECNYTVQGSEFNPSFVENCPGAVLSNSFNNTSTLANADLPKGSTTITWTVTDAMNMSSSSCQIVVNVTDNESPTITCPAGSPFARNTDAGQCNYTVQGAEFNPTFGDNCPGSTIVNNFNNTNTLAGADLPKGATTIIWTVIDGMSMSSAVCSITVNVTDNELPTIVCEFPSPFTRNADAGQCTYTVSGVEFDPVVFNDNCPGATISNNFNNLTTLSGAQLPGGANTIVWTVTDGMGMSSASCAIVVNVIDNTPPAITCPNPVTTECNRTDTLYTGVPTVANDCDVTFTFVNGAPTGNFPCDYSFVRTFTATDGSNNTTTCMQVISVRDTQAPVFTTCPANTTVECGASTEPMATGLPAIVDSCDASPVLSVHSDITVETPGPCEERVITRTWYAVDHCFNSRACVQTITVDDTTPPTLTCPASLTIECGTDTIPGPTAPTGQATATDNCGPVTVTYSSVHIPVMNNCPDVRLIFRTWTATDACGNVSTCAVQNIIIRDTQAPTLTNPAADLTVECDGAGNTSALNAWLSNNGGATASDVCAGVTWSNNYSALSDGCGATGTATVTFTATDACGHTTASVATFTVLDNTAPTITCPPADLTLECDGNYISEIAAWVATATATDACDAAPLVSTDWNGSDVPALNCGLTSGLTIQFTATDACSKTATCSRTVYVDDTAVPTITCPTADLTLECDGNYISEIAAWAATATASDACDATPTITDNWNDVDVPALSCDLSSGLTITFTATDDCNNSASCSRTVYVDDTAVPTITCPAADLTLECDGNYISEIAAWVATATASDVCDATPTITDSWNDVDVPALSCDLSSGLTITFTATDDCNNTATCSRTVYVDDTAVPTITCPVADLTLECDGNYISEIAAWVATATASDVCDATPTVSDDWNDVDVPALSCDLSSGLTITFTATDDCNNTATCSRTVYVDDTVVPSITCPADTVINCEISSLPAVTGTATATDNCDAMPTVTFSDGTPVVHPNCADSISFVRTWLAVDDCGNQSSCFQTITKQDTTDPVITCPGDVLVSCENPHTPAQTGSATATDNCDGNLIIFHTDQAVVGNCPQDSVISRRWIAVDNCGNLDICIQTITVRDLTPPVPVCPANTTIACNADTSAAAVGVPTVTDNCDMTPTVFHNNVITPGGLCAQTYTITRTWTAVDDCGNSNTCSQTINVQDIVAPVLVCAPNVTVECSDNLTPGPLGPNHPTGIAVAADNCDISPTVLLDDEVVVAGSCAQDSIITRTWVALDDCANGTACVQTIVLRDRTAPTWSTIAGSLDRTLECSDATGIAAAQSLAPVASDNCDSDVTNISKTAGSFVPGTQCPQSGAYTNTWTVTDDCGNTSSVFTQIITITDTTRPVVIAPNGIDIECSTVLPAAATTISEYLALPGALASDNCTMTPDLAVSSSTGTFTGTQCNGSFIRTYTITDQCGNSTSVTQTITVTDNTAPGITCPADTVINCEVSQLPADIGIATATDNCDTAPVVTPSDNTIAGNCPNNYTIQRTWTAIDACQNSATCLQTIAVQDTTRPVLTCPADVTVNCDASTLPANTGTATATDNCAPTPMVSHSDAAPVPGACANAQSIARTWMAVDACGNSAITCVQTITVQDTTKPVITCPSGTTVNCENTTPAVAGTATATDNCDPMPVISHDDQSTQTNTGACTDQTYTITRTWKATDACNNVATCNQTIFVQDTTRPAMICPLNITINCEVDTVPTITGQPIVQDNCDLTPGVTYLDVLIPGNCPDNYVIRRRWIAVDNCANINACEHFITVQDTTKPVLTIPADITLDCQVDLSPAGQAGMATATDNCTTNPIPTHLDNTTPGACAQSYTITRTWTVVDACGNSTSGVQTIFVRDITAPAIQCPADRTISCEESTDPNVNTALGKAIAIDNCDPMPIVTFIDAKNQFGPCIRDTIITRTWGVLDNCNNAAACQQTITKKDTQGPVVTCPADTVINCNTSILPAALGTASAVDNCGVASTPIFSDAPPVTGQCPQESVITRTWSSTDDCSNVGTCVQTITVQDTTKPVITCPAGLTVQCDESTDPMDTGVATATDNCDMSPVIDYSDVSTQATVESCPFYQYTITRTWSATDACGKSETCVQIIEVVDTEAPTITCPPTDTINCENGLAAIPSMTGSPTTSDNCDPAPPFILITVNGVPDMDCPQMITYTLTWFTQDYCQNSATCQQIVVAQDTSRPVITCPADATVECDQPTTPTATGSATAQDNCDTAPVIDSFDGTVPGNCPANYTILRTWRATDACDNETTCLQTINVQDTTDPVVLTCPPATVTVECGQDESPMATGVPTASDNCDPGVSYDYDDVVETAGLQCPLKRRITRTWTVSDDCGNSLTGVCTQTILVFDNTAPLIACPADITVNCDDPTHPDSLNMFAVAIDACDLIPTIVWDDEGSTAPCSNDTLSAIVRTWFAFDVCGNVAVCDQVIALIDDVAPVINCPLDTVINCEVLPSYANTGFATATDNCDANPLIENINEFVTPDPDCPQAYTLERTFAAFDLCGNSSTCVQTITVQDTTRPLIVCPANITIECDESTDPSNTGSALALDNCDQSPVITHTNLPATPLGGCSFNRKFTRVWLAGDACDNGALCQQTITILDTEGPVVTCPTSVTIECGSDTSAIALGFATASDNCGTATTPVRSDAVTLGNCPQEYTIARTWTSVDDCGNVGTCVQTISVDDSTPPTFTEPADITIYADANCGYDAGTTATGDVTNEADNCATGLDATFSDVIADGQCAGHKIITRTWSLNDGCGNVTMHDQIITVLDTLSPIFPKPDDVTLTTDAGATCPATADISLTISQSTPVATGNAAFTFTVHGITQDGPTVYGDNCSFGDSLKLYVWNIQEDFDGNADSCYRLIRVLWRVYDDCGNFQQRQQRFTILENKAPEITFCPPSLTVNCEDSTLPTATGEATASDNCDPMPVVTYSDVEDPGACPQEKTIARTWTVTDNCGNSTQCAQTITVVDDEAPVLVCPPNTTVSCDDPSPVAAGMATATDNCDTTPTIDFNDQSTQTNLGLCSDQTYMIIRTWSAYDDCGNQAIACEQTVSVRDVVAPVITCPADATVNCEDELNPAINMTLGTATSVDNCDPDPGVTYTDFPTPGNCPNERSILRTWLTVDNCNNPAACTQTITVVDDTAPTVVCPANVTVNCEVDTIPANTGGFATATDNCDTAPVITRSDVSTPGACPVLFTIARTWLAVDACGNSTICVQTITVQDTTRPVIICPANVTVQCNESIDPMVNPNVGVPTLSDNCDEMLAANKIDVPLPPNGCTQVVLRNWITADDCNNAAACSQTLTITDSQAPTLVGVPDVTLQCGDAIPPVGSPTVSDNCDTNPSMSYIGEDIINGQCPGSYVIQRSWSLGDACGNSTVFVQTITVQDTQAPVWTNAPADVTVECDAIPAVANPTATDVCDNDVTVTYGGETRTDGECGDFYTLTRTWTATDNCNNTTEHSQTILVVDTTAPTWESALPADMTVECGQVPQPATLVAEDNCDLDVEVEFGETSAEGACPVRMILTRTWVAYDNCSNSTVHTQTITVTDTTPPVADCVDITVELDQNGTATVTDDVVDAGSSDNCGAVQLLLSQTSFDCDNLGDNTVQLTVTDGCGLMATCTATVTVEDNLPPVWTSQPGELDRTVECGDAGGLAAAQSLAPVATDNCDDNLAPVKTAGDFIASTNCPPVGTYTNSWTVTDASGNTSTTFTQIITIADTTKPVLTCPAGLTLECSDEDKAAQIADWLAAASVTDNCGGMLVPDNDYDGDSIPPVACDLSEGLTVNFTVSDNCGNSAACSASIYVLDTEAPTINGDCALLGQYGNASNAASYIVGTSAGAECPAVAQVNLQVGQEISDTFQIKVGGVPVPGILGCLSDNCTPAENLIARVVAIQQSGDNCGKIFDVRLVLEDACGNQSADTLRYVLELIDNTVPTFTAPADVTVYLNENCDVDLSGTGDVTDEQDNCQNDLNATYTDVEVPAQGVSEYIIERTWTLNDGCGNSTIQVQYITVLDTIKPDFGCPSSVEVAPNSAGCTFVVDGNSLDPDDPTDNCGTILLSYDLSGATDSTGTGSLDGMAFNEGTTTVVWTVSDGNGNSVTCSFVVVVTQCIQISGTLIWEGDDSDMTGVAQAMVALSGDGTDTDGPTVADGKYTLISGSGGNFVVTPTKTSPPADPLNGVSTLDALLVQQYIVGLHTFPDGYKMIAADVNMSNAITTLDASLIRQAILGSPGALAYFLNKPWRFVPTKDDTPYSMGYDPGSDPFASPIPSTRNLTGVAADAIGEDFYGIKTGDVNATGNPQNKPENLEPLRLRIQDRTLESGQNIFVPVRMSAYDQLAGFQVAFDFDTDVLELISVEPITSPLGLTPAGHFGLYKAAEGEIRSAWIDPYGKTIAEEMPVFALRFVVKQSGAKLSEVFGMKPKAISSEAYNMDHEVAGIELEFYEEQTTSTFDPLISDVPGMTLQQNRPNPFTDRTLIGFSLDQGCDAQLRILDASGRELYRIDNYYPAGKHEELIYLRDLRATGVLYYQLRTPYGTLTRKMTALAP